jgi:hypothetical protein
MSGDTGHIDDIDITLLRDAYVIKVSSLNIFNTDQERRFVTAAKKALCSKHLSNRDQNALLGIAFFLSTEMLAKEPL